MMLYIDEELCTGCGVCVEACPLKLLKPQVVEDIEKVGFGDSIKQCTGCMACVEACSEYAISFTGG